LQEIRDDGIAVCTNEGFYSRRFSQKDVAEMLEKTNAKVAIEPLTQFGWIAIAKKQ